MTDWATAILGELTIAEKLALLSGVDSWHTVAIDRLGIPALKVTDGPNGARGADGNHGPTSTSFPVGVAMGATWDPALIEEVGRALAHETAAKGAHVLLGPTVNIPRVPNAGRNFECFSEDPLLSGTIAAAWIGGVQSEGIAACIKHFVCNDQEHDRHEIDAVVPDRALHEIYLEPFRIAIELAKPWAVMSAYNRINGTTASEHPMLDDVLRDELGFEGLVISDWYGTYGPGAMSSGLDLEMPGPGRWFAPDAVQAALEAGEVSEEHIDRKVGRLLQLMERTQAGERQGGPERADERAADRALARRVAIESMVLLTNDDLLPLTTARRVAVIGDLAADTPNQGGGSSSVNPHRVVSILEGVRSAAGADVDVTWTPGCRVRRSSPPVDPESLRDAEFTVEYFAGGEPVGEPVRTVTSSRSYFGFFGNGDEWVDYSDFSLRVSGTFVAQTAGNHRFSFQAAGRLRVSVGGDVVGDEWASESREPVASSHHLEAGEAVELTVEYGAVPGETWRWLQLGCVPPGPKVSSDAAAVAAADADVAIVVVGLTPEWESEGFDRPDLRLPADQDALISAVAAVQSRTVVVITAGSPVEMPWVDEVGAVVMAWYGGQEVGHAVADVLFGSADPGGRLPVTFPATSQQHPGLLNYPGDAGAVRYGEGVFVGYRGFDRLGLEPLFAFGHGLSFTTFDGDIAGCAVDGDAVILDIDISNVGDRQGVEVLQVFAHDVGGVDRRLVAFEKLALDAGDTTRVRLTFPLTRLRWWDPGLSAWRLPGGRVTLSLSGSFGTRITATEVSPE